MCSSQVPYSHWNSAVNSTPSPPLNVLFLLFEVGCKKIGREEIGNCCLSFVFCCSFLLYFSIQKRKEGG